MNIHKQKNCKFDKNGWILSPEYIIDFNVLFQA